jgi:hypothetical protein
MGHPSLQRRNFNQVLGFMELIAVLIFWNPLCHLVSLRHWHVNCGCNLFYFVVNVADMLELGTVDQRRRYVDLLSQVDRLVGRSIRFRLLFILTKLCLASFWIVHMCVGRLHFFSKLWLHVDHSGSMFVVDCRDCYPTANVPVIECDPGRLTDHWRSSYSFVWHCYHY